MTRSTLTEPPVASAPSSNGSSVRSGMSPVTPTRRRPSWVIAGVVAVGLAALLGAWVFASTARTMSVLVAAHDIAPGELVAASDMRVVEVGHADTLRALRPAQQGLVVGRAARGPIPTGTVLNTALFTDRQSVIPAGQVVVGAALDAGASPSSGLAAGDRVVLLGVAKTTAGVATDPVTAALLTEGTVWSVEPIGVGTSTARVWVSLLVPADLQAAVAQAAADGRLRLSLAGSAG
jgi:SAF domain